MDENLVTISWTLFIRRKLELSGCGNYIDSTYCIFCPVNFYGTYSVIALCFIDIVFI